MRPAADRERKRPVNSTPSLAGAKKLNLERGGKYRISEPSIQIVVKSDHVRPVHREHQTLTEVRIRRQRERLPAVVLQPRPHRARRIEDRCRRMTLLEA